MSRSLKVHWPTIAWGIAFGLAATITGIYVLAAIAVGTFFAEGFFLLVLGWVIIFVGAARIISKIEERGKARDSQQDEELK